MLIRHATWWLIRGYQLTLSSLVGGRCRFEPTCSHYAQEAVMRFGVVRGGWLAMRRIVRCGPFGGSGYDPVPETLEKRLEQSSKRSANLSKESACGCGKH